MIEFKFSCPHCNQKLEADDSYSGQQISCPACKQPFVVPQAPRPAAASDSAKAQPEMLRKAASDTPVPQPAPRVQPVGKPEKSTLALVSLILSILGMSIPAVICGHIARSRIKKNPLMSGRGFATAGLIIGYICFAIQIAVVAGAIFFAGSVLKNAENVMQEAVAKAKVESAQTDPVDSGTAGSDEASDILKKVNEQLQSFSSYSGSGSCTLDLDMSQVSPSAIPMPEQMKGNKDFEKGFKQATQQSQKMSTDFEFKLARPNQYRIEWTRNIGVANRTLSQKGAAWCGGDECFLLMPDKSYSKMNDRVAALGAASGASGGVAGIMPGMFFAEQNSIIESLKNHSKSEDETVDGEDCYVVNGVAMGQKMTFWITKSGHLIKQQKAVFGGTSTQELDEQQMKKTMESLGQKATPENMERMKKMMKGVSSMMSQMKGSMIIKYENIETNKSFSEADFKVELPSGAKLRPLMATPPM